MAWWPFVGILFLSFTAAFPGQLHSCPICISYTIPTQNDLLDNLKWSVVLPFCDCDSISMCDLLCKVMIFLGIFSLLKEPRLCVVGRAGHFGELARPLPSNWQHTTQHQIATRVYQLKFKLPDCQIAMIVYQLKFRLPDCQSQLRNNSIKLLAFLTGSGQIVR